VSLLLLDTQLLLWAAGLPERLSAEARGLLEDAANRLAFSAASIWEVVIKAGLGREDFRVDARRLRRGLLEAGYAEMAVTAEHALAVARLPALHKDPFDRMLLAQAETEGAVLLTADAVLARYGGAVRFVG
jgi:PIN domain nuclease of toxin-antitoxin system